MSVFTLHQMHQSPDAVPEEVETAQLRHPNVWGMAMCHVAHVPGFPILNTQAFGSGRDLRTTVSSAARLRTNASNRVAHSQYVVVSELYSRQFSHIR